MPILSSVSKYFTMANEGFATTLNGSVDDNDTTFAYNAFSGYTNGDSVFHTIDATDSGGTATPALKEVVYGEKSSNNLINIVRGIEGTAQSHASGATVADYVTAAHWASLTTGLLVQHKVTGAHANTITTDTINENTSANGVTIDGVNIKDGALTTSGSAPIPAVDLGSTSNAVATSQTTTSTSFTDLSTAGPAVTITVPASGELWLSFGCNIANSVDGGRSFITLVVSGANTVAAADDGIYSLEHQAAGNAFSSTAKSFLVTGLTAGSTTFTMKYKVGGSTGTFRHRYISAEQR